MYEKAREDLSNLANPDALARKGLFRVWASLARIAHVKRSWDEALLHWNKASGALQRLGQQENSHNGLVRYATAHALSKRGKLRESSDVMGHAKGLLDGDDRRYWIVGFEFYWL